MPRKNRPCGNSPACQNFVYRETVTGLCRPCLDQRIHEVQVPIQDDTVPFAVPSAPQPVVPRQPAEQVKSDQAITRLRTDLTDLKAKYASALTTIERQGDELGILEQLRAGVDRTIRIEPREGSGTSEATPVLVASDWHCEETVKSAQVNGLNEFNLAIADQRITKFWQSGLRLIRLLNQDVAINNVVVGLLGDFITNDIHEELVENVSLSPTQAIIWVQDRIIAGLQFLLDHSKYDFTVVCRVGNHSRTTHKVHFSTENGHSLEHLMYVHLQAYFRNEPRIQFVIQDGYHVYVDVYDQTLRFHHGHAIKYGGGIGGLFIPAYKAVGTWSQARHASLDVFGHFHQSKDGGSFLCNGSLIGYNAFALQIKATCEPPRQTLFLVDKRRGRTCSWPVVLD
jgi:hypothetical protein